MHDFDVIVVGAGPAGAAAAVRCTQLQLRTLLVERGAPGRSKLCGGILPTVTTEALDELGLRIPEDAMCSPPVLGLFYVPPSGRKNGGSARNYRLLNVRRERFDLWMQEAAKAAGAELLYETEFLGFEETGEGLTVTTARGNLERFSARFLVGADGVFSKVRKQLYPASEVGTLAVLQEHWKGEGEFSDHFCALFKGEVTPTYGYVIPKDGLLVVGTGAPRNSPIPVSMCIERLKAWLHAEFAFKPTSLRMRRGAAIPYDSPACGEGNVVLVGDAAGFCNPLSGEGVRLAIESGVAAAEAAGRSRDGDGLFSSLYVERVEWLSDFVRRIQEFVTGLTDERREEFVKAELARCSLDP